MTMDNIISNNKRSLAYVSTHKKLSGSDCADLIRDLPFTDDALTELLHITPATLRNWRKDGGPSWLVFLTRYFMGYLHHPDWEGFQIFRDGKLYSEWNPRGMEVGKIRSHHYDVAIRAELEAQVRQLKEQLETLKRQKYYAPGLADLIGQINQLHANAQAITETENLELVSNA